MVRNEGEGGYSLPLQRETQRLGDSVAGTLVHARGILLNNIDHDKLFC